MNKGETLHCIQETHDRLLLSSRYSNYEPYMWELELNSVQCKLKIDTGCLSTLISKKQFDFLPYASLSKERTILRLWTYSDEVIMPNGIANLKVKYQGKMYDLRVLVVPGSGPSFLGRDWLEKLPINISATCNQIEWTNLNQEFAERSVRPWFWVHMDYADPIQGKWILVIIDAHSKYIEAHVVSSPSSSITEKMLTHMWLYLTMLAVLLVRNFPGSVP